LSHVESIYLAIWLIMVPCCVVTIPSFLERNGYTISASLLWEVFGMARWHVM